jgi:carbonic anhydrase
MISRVARSVAAHGPRHLAAPAVRCSSSSFSSSETGNSSLEVLFRNNREYVQRMTAQDPEFFSKHRGGQKPRFLYIGCADSRVPAQEMMGMKPGEMFVTRNVANLVVNSGGVRAGHSRADHGLVEHWVKNVRDVARMHAEELRGITDEQRLHRRMVELNVIEQCVNLHANSVIQKALANTGLPRIHGIVYDIGEGLIREIPNTDIQDRVKASLSMYDVGHLAL